MVYAKKGLRCNLLIDLGGSTMNKGNIAMTKNDNVISLETPVNPLEALLKQGAQALLSQAIEAELAVLLAQYQDETMNGQQRVVRNGHQPERTIQTGLGDIDVKIPKVRDRKKEGIKFNSALVPPY